MRMHSHTHCVGINHGRESYSYFWGEEHSHDSIYLQRTMRPELHSFVGITLACRTRRFSAEVIPRTTFCILLGHTTEIIPSAELFRQGTTADRSITWTGHEAASGECHEVALSGKAITRA
jgi:hypothetical protein